MIKKVYTISGFDCPNCAANAECHLNKQDNIDSAVIDFNNERLYITYKDEPLSIEQIISLINEVEEDEITITHLSDKKEKVEEEPIFNKETILLLVRIFFIIALMVTAKILESTILDQRSWQVIALYLAALIIGIYDIFLAVIKNIIHKVNPIDEHLLMLISCIGAFCIVFFKDKDTVFFDGVMVLALFQIGELIEDILSNKSKSAIKKAIDLRAETANLIKGEEVISVSPESLNIDDLVMIKVGEKIPVDGEVISGSGTLDNSSLTGESVPVDVSTGSILLSGATLSSGSVTMKVLKTFENSTVSKIMELVESSGEKKSKVDKFITKFARIYTPIVLLIAILYTVIFGFIGGFAESLYGGVFILIIGCPCSIVISVPLAFFAGIGLASRNGIVIKGATYLDQLYEAGVLFIDKTGTLTYGNFELSKVSPIGINEEEFMNYLLSAECLSTHPIAKAIIKNRDVSKLSLKQNDYQELAGYGILTYFEGHEIYAGNINLLKNNGVDIQEENENGTIIYLAVDKEYVGYVVLSDIVRNSSKEMIKRLNKLGINVVLLSGDNKDKVKNTAEEVGIKEYYGELLPQDKAKYVSNAVSNKKNKKQVLFAGDGINDTPSIMLADVGIAMGGIGSDVAVSNADVIIMHDDPIKIAQAIDISRKARHVAIFNIVFAISIKVIALVLTMLSGTINFPPHFIPLVDALSDTGLTVLLVINSLLLIYRKIK